MSQTGSSPDARPDDRRILNELEELQQAILASRATRERAEAAFDSELRAFDEPRPVTAPAAVDPPPPRELAVTTASWPVAPDLPSRMTLPKPNPSPDVALFDDSDPPPAALPPRSRAPLITSAIAVVVGVGLASLWIATRAPEPGPTANPATQAATPAVPAAEEPAQPAKAVPADPHALRIDLTSLRRVWLRVSVDGRIALEREVSGGEQLPFGADRSIVVRAGDAGAVTVRVGTAEQGPLGRDGQVVTRAFTVPER
jgi:hypothetical protein